MNESATEVKRFWSFRENGWEKVLDLTLPRGESGGVPSITVLPFELQPESWTASAVHADYAFQADIEIAEITPQDNASIEFDAPSVIRANAAGVLSGGETTAGAVRVFAKKAAQGVLTGYCVVYKGVA